MAEPASENFNRRSPAAFRRDLVLTSCFATAAFAVVVTIAVFVPLAAQLGRAEVSSEQIVGLAELQSVVPKPCDHRGIVNAEPHLG